MNVYMFLVSSSGKADLNGDSKQVLYQSSYKANFMWDPDRSIYDENCVEYTHSFQPTVLIHEIQAFHLINTFIIQCHFLEYNNAQNDNKYHAVFVL